MQPEPHPLVIVIDDHQSLRDSLRALLESADFRVRDYPSAVAFLAEGSQAGGDCLVVDMRMPEMSGLELHEELSRRNFAVPLILVT